MQSQQARFLKSLVLTPARGCIGLESKPLECGGLAADKGRGGMVAVPPLAPVSTRPPAAVKLAAEMGSKKAAGEPLARMHIVARTAKTRPCKTRHR